MHGIVVLNKPTGQTSRRALDAVERLVRPAKAGHAGTLDPLADGVLVVCIGAATRLIEYVQQMPKRYVAAFLLGRSSPTEDLEGDVVELPNPPRPAREQILAALPSFTGPIEQRPPAFSALKIGGQRAYDLARKGRQVDLEPRPVTIHRLELLDYEYPTMRLAIECSSGTYVRSLGRDIAVSLGTAAVMSALTRTAIGRFTLDEAVPPDSLTAATLPQHLLPSLRAVDRLPIVQLDDEQQTRIRNGLPIPRPGALADSEQYAAIDADGRLIGILGPREPNELKAIRNLPP
jgi:tRNA pseudouridine55 synthase